VLRATAIYMRYHETQKLINMKNVLILLGILFLVGQIKAQDKDISVKVELERDSVGYEEMVRVTFTIENAKDFKFEQPDFSEFESAQRSGTQSNMSMINGQMTQSIGYTYTLNHFGKGSYYIEPATFIVEGEEYITDKIKVVVTDKAVMPRKKQDNPYPLFNERRRFNPFGMPDSKPKPEQKDKNKKKKSKKKRKVYKI
jgi:hypothetical protein